jgi:hypothetical protein
MTWDVETSDEFTAWYNGLDDDEADSVDAAIELLEKYGPMLGRPHADVVHQSSFRNMKELRVQHQGRPYRILFAFDPRRCAYLILGGDKTGNDTWYDEWVPVADRIYKQHLAEIRE